MLPISRDMLIERIALLPPFLLSLTIHEYAHARTALAFGDPTARDHGRVTLNPLAHLDPMGTLCLVLTGMFGWAKPVPVNPYNLHPRRLGDIAVSVAGPLSNLLLAVMTGVALRLWWAYGPEPAVIDIDAAPVGHALIILVTVNVCLCVFNLVPLFPLDGHHVAREVLPAEHQSSFMHWQIRYGSIILMVLIFGPRLLRMFLPDAPIPDPLGWVFRHALRLTFRGLLFA